MHEEERSFSQDLTENYMETVIQIKKKKYISTVYYKINQINIQNSTNTMQEISLRIMLKTSPSLSVEIITNAIQD